MAAASSAVPQSLMVAGGVTAMVSILCAAACVYLAFVRLRQRRSPLARLGGKAKGKEGAGRGSEVVMSVWNPLSPRAGRPAAPPAKSPKKERKGEGPSPRRGRRGGGGPLSASSAQAQAQAQGGSGEGVGGFLVSNPLIKSRGGGAPAPSV